MQPTLLPAADSPQISEYSIRADLMARFRLDARTVGRYVRSGCIPPPDLTLSTHTQFRPKERLDAWVAEQAAAGVGCAS